MLLGLLVLFPPFVSPQQIGMFYLRTARPVFGRFIGQSLKHRAFQSAAEKLTFISPEDLAAKIKDGNEKPGYVVWLIPQSTYLHTDKCISRVDYLVLDVREPWDFSRLHIRSAVNIPSPLILTMSPEALLGTLQLAAERASGTTESPITMPPHFIFHCTVSLVRGPTTAVKVIEILRRTKAIEKKPTVSVLEGGFATWKKEYGKDGSLVVGMEAPDKAK